MTPERRQEIALRATYCANNYRLHEARTLGNDAMELLADNEQYANEVEQLKMIVVCGDKSHLLVIDERDSYRSANDALTAENATLRTQRDALVTAGEAFILAVDAHRDALDNLEMEESDDHAIKEIAANGVLLDSKRALSAAVAEAKGEK